MSKYAEEYRDAIYNLRENTKEATNKHPRTSKLAAVALSVAMGAAAFANSDSIAALWRQASLADMARAAEDQANQAVYEGAVRVADLACQAGLKDYCPPTGQELFDQMQGGQPITEVPGGSLIKDEYQTVS